MDLPFDGAISRYFKNDAPADLRRAIKDASARDILSPGYPYPARMPSKDYEREYDQLQIELVRMQAWVKETGQRIAILFEGRDAAGKGGTIKRFVENLNTRGARVVALPKPTDEEATQWYFQRYVEHLPAAGEIVFFDRSWYNRAIVEKVFDFCTVEQREKFFRQVLPFEQMLVGDGIRLYKFWISIGRAEQLRRFLAREQDLLKQWKLSRVDVEGLAKWDDYTKAIEETFLRSHSELAPWTVVRGDDKRRARLAAIRRVLVDLDYDRKDAQALGTLDPLLCGGPDLYDD
ncbi:polyphosphate kinase 2 [Chachezhania sediminis]|uniref:polyphosphate kinase 2 n=1 Tax=Chachezhania sediminis TaxID=2599291 RepID=UPI00131E1BC3|nr:polyphosphate kinase 2 [Chachezhania sediminis]